MYHIYLYCMVVSMGKINRQLCSVSSVICNATKSVTILVVSTTLRDSLTVSYLPNILNYVLVMILVIILNYHWSLLIQVQLYTHFCLTRYESSPDIRNSMHIEIKKNSDPPGFEHRSLSAKVGILSTYAYLLDNGNITIIIKCERYIVSIKTPDFRT